MIMALRPVICILCPDCVCVDFVVRNHGECAGIYPPKCPKCESLIPINY